MNLLVLRGFRDRRCWGDFPRRLVTHAPHLNFHAIDLPGVGSEYRRQSPDTVAGIRVDTAKRFHEAVSAGKLPKEPWSVMGLGLGGMIALDWADTESSLFQNVIVINASATDLVRVTERFRPSSIPDILRVITMTRADRIEKAMLKMNSNRYAEMEPVLAQQIAWRKERPVTRKTLLRQGLAALRFRLPIQRLTPRTIVISSEADRLIPSLCSVRLAERLGAARLSHPWAGHDISIDDPEWLAQRTRELLPDPNAPKARFRT